MRRVSTNMSNIDMQYHLMLREYRMNNLNNKMGAQSRIKELRDDPLAAARSTKYQSKIFRMQRFQKNIEMAQGNLAQSETQVMHMLDVLQRMKELSVQGANGIYGRQELRFMGDEVNELFNEILAIANSKNGIGNALFAGFDTKQDPFRTFTGYVPGGKSDVVTAVEYTGDFGRNQAEISEGVSVDMNLPGNWIFWAENQQIYSTIDATAYQVQKDAKIRIDGVEIELQEGDNVYAIISKINDSQAPVKASLDPIEDSLVLETLNPHQIWIEDMDEGTVLQDLGILNQGSARPPHNIANSATVFGGSIFDMIIHLRDSLYSADTDNINRAIHGVDDSINSITSALAEIGSIDERLYISQQRIEYEIPEYIKLNSQDVDLDITQAITELKMLEYAHQAALATAARTIKTTLLDFMR